MYTKHSNYAKNGPPLHWVLQSASPFEKLPHVHFDDKIKMNKQNENRFSVPKKQQVETCTYHLFAKEKEEYKVLKLIKFGL